MRQQIESNEQLFATIANTTDAAVSMYNENLQCIVWNDRSEAMFKHSKGEAIGNCLSQLVTELDEGDRKAAIDQIAKGEPCKLSFESDRINYEVSCLRNETAGKSWVLVIAREKQVIE